MQEKLITEASDDTRQYHMSKNDIYWKKRIIDLLRNDGKGHRYNAYADRLEKFGLNIVPLKAQRPGEIFTAGISYATGLIYVSEGFLDEDYLYQLSVLLRHELAHNLMMHEVRMMYKLGKDTFDQFSVSQSIQDILNVIMDDEISNRRYSAYDKEVVRHMKLNGEVIGGLVTEDHRASWKDMSLEEMYDALCKEIKETNDQLKSGWGVTLNPKDPVQSSIIRMMCYKDIESDSVIYGDIEEFIKGGCWVKTEDGPKQWAKPYRELAEFMLANIKKDSSGKDAVCTEKLIDRQLQAIKDSAPMDKVDLISLANAKVYGTIETPEEKHIAVEIIKKYRSEYDAWYKKVIAYFNSHRWDINNADLKALRDTLKG